MPPSASEPAELLRACRDAADFAAAGVWVMSAADHRAAGVVLSALERHLAPPVGPGAQQAVRDSIAGALTEPVSGPLRRILVAAAAWEPRPLGPDSWRDRLAELAEPAQP